MIPQRIKDRVVCGLAAIAVVGLFLAPGAQAAAGTATAPETSLSQSAQQTSQELAQKWGVEIVGIRLTAANSMLDVRYRVIDPDKAAPILNRRYQPYLIDQATNTTLGIMTLPKIGRLRQDTMRPEAGRTYFMVFANPGWVRAKSKVTLVVGDFRAENLSVEG